VILDEAARATTESAEVERTRAAVGVRAVALSQRDNGGHASRRSAAAPLSPAESPRSYFCFGLTESGGGSQSRLRRTWVAAIVAVACEWHADRRLNSGEPGGVTLKSYTCGVPSKHPRIAVTADPELTGALERVRVATGTSEPDATLVRRLAVEGAGAELSARDQRRAAAEALLSAMDDGEFDLDPDAVDRLNRLTPAE
jgi:hypothetical protein